MSSMLKDHEHFVGSSTSGGTGDDASSLRIRVADLESEVQQLREHLGKAKGINDTMWNTVVQRVVKTTDDRPTKRGRTNT